MKKIKNPEKYIERLKRRIARHNKHYEWLRQKWLGLRGTMIVNWKAYDQEFTVSDAYFDAFPGDEVIIIGRVKRVENEIDLSCKNKSGTLTVKIQQARKVEGFLNKEVPDARR